MKSAARIATPETAASRVQPTDRKLMPARILTAIDIRDFGRWLLPSGCSNGSPHCQFFHTPTVGREEAGVATMPSPSQPSIASEHGAATDVPPVQPLALTDIQHAVTPAIRHSDCRPEIGRDKCARQAKSGQRSATATSRRNEKLPGGFLGSCDAGSHVEPCRVINRKNLHVRHTDGCASTRASAMWRPHCKIDPGHGGSPGCRDRLPQLPSGQALSG